MQALRAARNAASIKPCSLFIAQRRCLETATVNLTSAASSSTVTAPTGARTAPFPLYNIEAHWDKLSGEEKITLHEQLEALQVKDWKELSLIEKKAGGYIQTPCTIRTRRLQCETDSFSTAYFVAFGPHGPRAPAGQPGDNVKIFFSTLALIALGGAIFYAISGRSSCFPFSSVSDGGAYEY